MDNTTDLTYGLFDSFDAKKDGVHLSRFELYNWGGFSGKPFVLTPLSSSELLMGTNGTGKSTLMDAFFLVLLNSQNFNPLGGKGKRGRSNGDNRTLLKYVRGVSRNNSSLFEQKDTYMRNTNDFSVLLAVFEDTKGNQITIGHFYTCNGNNVSKPKAFYFVARSSISIEADFLSKKAVLESDLKNHLKNKKNASIYTNFSDYYDGFRSLIGLPEKNIARFIHTVSSLKNIESFNDFIRDFIIDSADVYDDGDKLVESIDTFYELNASFKDIHKQIIELKQLDIPFAEYNKANRLYEEFDNEKKLFTNWVKKRTFDSAKKTIKSSETRNENYLRDLDVKRQGLLEKEKLYYDNIKRINSLKDEFGIDKLENESKDLITKINDANKALERLKPILNKLDVSLTDYSTYKFFVDSIDSHIQHFNQLLTLCCEKEESLNNKKNTLIKNLEDKNDELTYLKNHRDTNIDFKLARLRNDFANHVSCRISDIPFAGELIKIKESENKWQGALERLLHPLSVSLLVPKKFYSDAVKYFGSQNLKLKLIFYKIDDDFSLAEESFHANDILDKLVFNPNAPKNFIQWVQYQISSKYNHKLVDRYEDLKNERFALSIDGIVKNDSKHVKDDRHEIDDRSFWCIGFDNKSKLEDCKNDIQNMKNSLAEYQSELKSKNEERSLIDICIDRLNNFPEWEKIDVTSFRSQLSEVKRLINNFSNSDNAKEIARLEEETKHYENSLNNLREEMATISSYVVSFSNTIRKMEDLCAERISYQDFSVSDESYDKFSTFCQRCDCSSENLADKEKQYIEYFSRDINDKMKEQSSIMEQSKINMNDLMTKFQENFPHVVQCSTDFEDYISYKEAAVRLEKEDLVNKGREIKEMYHKTISSEIKTLKYKVDNRKNIISSQIETVNNVLSKFKYNTTCYVKITHKELPETDSNNFRNLIDKLNTMADESFNEDEESMKYQEMVESLNELIGYFAKIPDGLSNYALKVEEENRRKLIDVKYSYMYMIETKNFSTNDTVNIYTSSGSLSGGEGEKIAYFLLLACYINRFHLFDAQNESPCFKTLFIDEIFAKMSTDNARSVLKLMKDLGIQCIFIRPNEGISVFPEFIRKVAIFSKASDDSGLVKFDEYEIEDFIDRSKKAEEELRKKIADLQQLSE